MQSAETVLGVLRERGRRGLPCGRAVSTAVQPAVVSAGLRAHLLQQGCDDARGHAGDRGRHVPGQDRAHHRCDAPRALPVHARSGGCYIPKKNGKTRPLGLPTWSDKLVGEVVRLLLEAYYEPTFSDRSHGFRPGRGCHTALREVANTWTGTTWFIEGDIADCFGSLDHEVMLRRWRRRSTMNRFLRLVRNMLHSRIPGGLDLERHAQRRAAGRGRIPDPVEHLSAPVGRLRRDSPDPGVHPRGTPGTQPGLPGGGARDRDEPADAVTAPRCGRCASSCAACPARILDDPGYRRLRYVRYADDTLLGFAGPKAEAEEIKAAAGGVPA